MKKSSSKEHQKSAGPPPEAIREMKKLLRKNPNEARCAYSSPETMKEISKLSPEDLKRILEADTSKGPVRVKLKGRYRAARKSRS
jgi:hypothetical protein